MVPCVSAAVRRASPPIIHSPRPYAAILTNGRRFATAETLGIGRGGREEKTGRGEIGETRKK